MHRGTSHRPGPERAPRRLAVARPRPRVLIVSGSVGAGHDGAAAALATRLRGEGVHVDQQDYLQALPAVVRGVLAGCYALIVNYAPAAFGWLFASIERHAVTHQLSLAICGLAQRRVEQWLRPGYQAVVSTYPLASQTLGQLRGSGRLGCPVVTFLTDPAVHRLWVHSAVDHHLTVTQATADHGSSQYAVPMQVGGPLVAAAFSRPTTSPAAAAARAAIRAQWGVDDATPVALVLTGSLGMGDVSATVDAVLAGGVAVPVVACGRNERLRRQLSDQLGARALSWRDDMPDLMAAADVLITNAGGLSFTEALVAGLPAVCFAPIPGHGQANAAVLHAAGLAPWARTHADLTLALRAATSPGRRTPLATPPPCAVDVFVTRLFTTEVADLPRRPRRFSRRRPRAAA